MFQLGVLLSHTFSNETIPFSQDEVLVYLTGSELTENYLAKHGFSRPILIRSTGGLGMRVPPSNLTIQDIERYVGMCSDSAVRVNVSS